jgi:DNA repair ATPase RecN
MDDIQPLRNFLKEIQGLPDLIYTQEGVDHYNQLKEKVRQVNPVDHQQELLQKQLVKKIKGLQELIREYEREITEAIQYLGAVTEGEKKHLKAAFHKIRKIEQEVQELLVKLP